MAKMQSMDLEEIKSLLRRIENPRWRLGALMGFWHGLRATEIITAKGRNIRSGMVRIKRLKGSEETIQPYIVHEDPDLDESIPLAALAAQVGPNDLLFPITRSGFFRVIQKAGLKAGIYESKCHPHALKHSIATQLITRTEINVVQNWLGHKNMSSTGAYMRLTDEKASRAVTAVVGARLFT